jgi:hypothetical protein
MRTQNWTLAHLSQISCLGAVLVYAKGANIGKALMKSFSVDATVSISLLSFDISALIGYKVNVPVIAQGL